MISPLPVRTRLVGGEGVATYRKRHAANNLTSVADVERYVEEQTGQRLSASPRHPQVLQTWRELGSLHERAFTEPHVVAGNWVLDRNLCSRCGPPREPAHGRLPWMGWVCLKHRRWLGDPQVDLAGFGDALAAERHWRHTLAPRGVVLGSPVLRLAEEAALVGISKTLLADRAERPSVPTPGLLVYPEVVALARVLTRPSFLDLACDPDAPGTQRRTLVEREVYRILPDVSDAEAWRAVARVWTMVTDLSDLIRDARLVGMAPDDGKYNVLRYSRRLAQPPQGLGARAEADWDRGSR